MNPARATAGKIPGQQADAEQHASNHHGVVAVLVILANAVWRWMQVLTGCIAVTSVTESTPPPR